mmetsp:Transcript_22944/g.48388  ORF Transcript_22944/g.48388 Transcript_22944/m.48388 type:complete len:150 (-) Transcript_22944:28-477(-)
MDESLETPKTSHSSKALNCPRPPSPRKLKLFDIFDGEKKNAVVPNFSPDSCCIISTNDFGVMEATVEPSDSNGPASKYPRKRRAHNMCQTPRIKQRIKDFPTLPFSSPAPNNQSPTTRPSSDLGKPRIVRRRRVSSAHTELANMAFSGR